MIGGFLVVGDIYKIFDFFRQMLVGDEYFRVDEVMILNVVLVCLDELVLLSLKEFYCYFLK